MSCRNLILTLIILCLCCQVFFASAQCPDAAELNITATLYTQENGLTSNMLEGIARDTTGYRYFLGVEGKWIRYDGVNFSTSNNYDNTYFDRYNYMESAAANHTTQFINHILYKTGNEKNNARFTWSLAGDSLICNDITKKERQAFLLPKGLTTSNGRYFLPDGNICRITTSNTVFQFDILSKKFVRISLPAFPEPDLTTRGPLSIFSADNGNCYLLRKNAVLKLNNTSLAFEMFCEIPGKKLSLRTPEIIMQHYFFLPGLNAEFYEADLSNGSLRTFNLSDYTGISNTSALTVTALKNYNDYLLIGTANAGLFIFNRCTNAIQRFEYEKQHSGINLTNSIAWIATDDDNVIWMQTEAGLIKLEINNQKIKPYAPSSMKNGALCNYCNNVRSIYTCDNNNLLIGSFGGIYNFNLTSGEFSNLVSPVDKHIVWKDRAVGAITGDGNEHIFIGDWGNRGILMLNNKKKKLVNLLTKTNGVENLYSNIRCLFYDARHILWAGTDKGILRISHLDEFIKNNYSGNTVIVNQFTVRNNNAMRNIGECFAITGDANDNIWFGCTNGLYSYNYTTDSIVKYVHNTSDNSTISDNEVRSVYISKQDVWVGTNRGGLNHFDVATKKFSAFTTENGLPNNSIYTILEDNNGFLWLGTNAGLCRFNTTDHSVRNYTPRDGIQNYEFNTNASAALKDGRFCFGGRAGFNIFHPDSLNAASSPPKVVITSFKIFNKEFPVHDSIMHLAHDQNSLSFDFALLNFYRSGDNQYSYMMEGADKNWIKSGNRQYTSYNNLPPGTYTFKVRAANYTGMWNERATTMKFIIDPAWYNTLWFRIAIAFFIVAGVYTLYRYRLSQMLKLQAVRNSIASDLHDEIGSTLSSISLSSTIIQGKLNGSNSEAEKLLRQVSSNTDNMMEALSDIVWTINTRNDRFDNVINRMRAFAVEVLEPRNISIHFNVSGDIMKIQLDMKQRKNLYLIFKEAINNIAKYSCCKNVYIDISRQGNKTFVLNIKDDGKGFEVSVPGKEGKSLSGNGIRNIKKRASELGGELTIESVPAAGTTLNLRFTI